MKIIYRLFIFVLLATIFFLNGNFSFAICKSTDEAQTFNYPTQTACEAAGYRWISEPSSSGTVSLTNPLTGTQSSESIPVLLGKIINAVLGVIGSLALVMFIYGGATWMTSAGNQEQVTKGKQIIIWAALGIIMIFSAYALVKFVLTTITS